MTKHTKTQSMKQSPRDTILTETEHTGHFPSAHTLHASLHPHPPNTCTTTHNADDTQYKQQKPEHRKHTTTHSTHTTQTTKHKTHPKNTTHKEHTQQNLNAQILRYKTHTNHYTQYEKHTHNRKHIKHKMKQTTHKIPKLYSLNCKPNSVPNLQNYLEH